MKPRHLAPIIKKYAKQYPVLALVGPRQSGKTTLAKTLFPKHKYLSLENLDIRQHAQNDPRGFLEDHGTHVILDEVQRTPELFSYLQEIVDRNPESGQVILTGSSQFLLLEKITQSLAGRIATFKLYPFTFTELCEYGPDDNFESIYKVNHTHRPSVTQQELYTLIWQGFYPRIYDRQLDSYKWYENYISTYVERDVRSLLNVRNLRTFENFLKLTASHSGQLINYNAFSNALGVSAPTIKEWISIMEASGLIFILPPFFENMSKRLVKTPKLYFSDTGLLCNLLSIRSPEILRTHPLLGSIFETFIISECYKRFFNCGETPPLYFWRDQMGLEIDLLINEGQKSRGYDIKLAQTYHADFAKNLQRWIDLDKNPAEHGTVIYTGAQPLDTRKPISVIPWFNL